MYNQTCFLLSYVKYGDNDAVLHCFSEEAGYLSFFAKGIYNSKNKKKAYLFPLNKLQITVRKAKNVSSLPSVSRIESTETSYDFDDIYTNTILMFISEFLTQILKEEIQAKNIFVEIDKFLTELYERNYNSYITLIFRILSLQGLSPLFSEQKFLNPEAGNFSALQTHTFFDEKVSKIWKKYIKEENSYVIGLNRETRKSFLDSLMIYYKMHFTGFYEPRSLEIMQQIYR